MSAREYILTYIGYLAMNKLTVGIDIAKLTFVAAIKVQEGKQHKTKSFSNDDNGFKDFSEWLVQFSPDKYYCCMESTGKYGLALALFLHQHNHKVSIVNPARIKFYMQSLLSRNKTDKVDAKFIHDFSVTFSPSLWRPLPDKIQFLQALVMRSDALSKMLRQEKNRLENIEEAIYQSVTDHIEYIEKEMKVIDKKIAEHTTRC